jgi:hypothetical protein
VAEQIPKKIADLIRDDAPAAAARAALGLGDAATVSALATTATGSTTPRTLANRFGELFNVKDFGAVGDGVADDTAAIQATIDASFGGRTIPGRLLTLPPTGAALVNVAALGPVVLPGAVYRVTQPLRIWSATGFTLAGAGAATTIHPDGVTGDVIDINGSFLGDFRDFQISGQGGATGAIVNAIHYRWDAATADRSSSDNRFSKITILNVPCQVGFRIGTTGDGSAQVDTSSYHDLYVNGYWNTALDPHAPSGLYQAGIWVGSNAFGNNVIHNFYHVLVVGWTWGIYAQATEVGIWGFDFGANGVDFHCGSLSYACIQGGRSETSKQLLYMPQGGAAPANISIADVQFSCDGLISTGFAIEIGVVHGHVSLQNVQFVGGPGAASWGTTLPSVLALRGVSSFTPVDNFVAAVDNRVAIPHPVYIESNASPLPLTTVALSPTIATAATNLSVARPVCHADATAGAFPLKLPPMYTVACGYEMRVRNFTSNANAVTVAPFEASGVTIDGAASFTLPAAPASARFVSWDGLNWETF